MKNFKGKSSEGKKQKAKGKSKKPRLISVKNKCQALFTFAFCLLPFAFEIFTFQTKAQEVLPAQNFHQWGAVTLFSGLPSDNVRAIAQTGDGVLWFGTDNGLARFDGRRVQTFPLEAGESNKILALETSPTGTLWVGTERGAYFLQNEKFRRIDETKDFAITSVLFAENVFLASGDGGAIFKLREDAASSGSFQVEKIPEQTLLGGDGQPLKITSLARVGDKIIVGTRSRSILTIENNQTFETYARSRPFFVNALAQDKQGSVWLGADAGKGESGLFLLEDFSRSQKIGEGLGNVLAIEADAANGGVWVGTQSEGLFYFRGGEQLDYFTFENTAGGLRSNTIYAVFVDREGVLWIGTNRGVSRFDESSFFNQTLSEENTNSNFVRTFYRAKDGRIFAGTNRGLFSFSAADGAWVEDEKFAAKPIYAVVENSSNRLLIGAATGLFDSDGKQIFAGDVRSVANFKGKDYAAVHGRGVFQIENQTLVFAGDAANALFADGDERLWIGTTKGDVFTFDGKDAKPEKALETLRGAAIRKIAKGGESDLWLGGERGLFRYQNGELENVVAGRDVRDFLIVGGAEIWAATVKGGLVHARRDENFGWISTALNVEQGLPSEQIFALLRQENRFLIGTNRGVATYAPSAIAPRIIAARILSQRLHGAEEAAQTIKLDYPQNSLLVEVAGLSSRTFPEQFQYSFFLKNSNGDVLEKKLSSDAAFAPANLAAGEYQIEARAFNKDLLASEPLIIKFSVDHAPFPWVATALGALLVVAVAALIWAGIERKTIWNRNRELRAARFDLANEAERERKRIARDLHDQTLADLRNLMLMSDELSAETGDFRREIESVSTEIRRICEDLSPSVLENVGLIAALEFLVSHTIENYEFHAAENLEEKLNFPPNAQMQIYRVAQEVLNNIKRHSDAEKVEMRIEISGDEEEEFILSISDDGTFFSPAETAAKGQQRRGVSNIKSRAALIEAKASWQENETGGTLFQLCKMILTGAQASRLQ